MRIWTDYWSVGLLDLTPAKAGALTGHDIVYVMNSLRTIKLIHTVIWAFFVACILAIPFFTALSRFGVAALFAAIVAIEVLVLVLNKMSCPLTAVAAKHTSDRQANFDIYLPEWLAQHNKVIFGSLYVAVLAYLAARWL